MSSNEKRSSKKADPRMSVADLLADGSLQFTLEESERQMLGAQCLKTRLSSTSWYAKKAANWAERHGGDDSEYWMRHYDSCVQA